MDRKRAAYLFLSLLQARTGSSLVSRLGDLPPEEVLEMPAWKLAEKVKMTERAMQAFDDLKSAFDADALLAPLDAGGIKTVTPCDDAYPQRLREVPDPPPALFVDGEVSQGPTVALVGSRKASVTGLEAARELGRALGERGVCVVSGLALGIDAATHEGALAGGGPAVGVLECGIDVTYPPEYK